ncbi:hypothetical protein BDI4_580003 [Burkholderia diffusa]|nr:hypothetical protein BDI4_580003 [Burkholderia diffusa]
MVHWWPQRFGGKQSQILLTSSRPARAGVAQRARLPNFSYVPNSGPYFDVTENYGGENRFSFTIF